MDFGDSKDEWVCPNDRQLALRAKLQSGWSVKTHRLNSFKQPAPLNETEQEAILGVIKRAEMLEVTEQERIGRLVDRLENMKKHVLGNGNNQCILCGDTFRVLSGTPLLCHDCKRAVCQKCVIETGSSQKETISLCKICAETREMWKKSGAWFFKGLPKYVLPEKKAPVQSKYASRYIPGTRSPRPGLQRSFTQWAQKQGGSSSGKSSKGSTDHDDEEDSSEDELTRRIKIRSKKDDSSQDEGEMRQFSVKAASSSRLDYSEESGGANATWPQHDESDRYLTVGRRYSREWSFSEGSDPGMSRRPSFSRGSSFDPAQLRRTGSSETDGWYCVSPRGLRSPSPASLGPSPAPSSSSPLAPSLSPMAPSPTPSSGTYHNHHEGAMANHNGGSGRVSPEDGWGLLEFSLLYNTTTQTLHCTLHRAKGLRAMDNNGLSDPFCKLTLLPTDGVNSKVMSLKTKTMHKTVNPEFNETLAFSGLTESDLATRVLQIVVLDDDKYGQDFLGETRIPLSRLKMQLTKFFSVYLERQQSLPVDPSPSEVGGSSRRGSIKGRLTKGGQGADPGTTSRGKILLSLTYCTRRSALIVGIEKCSGLPAMDLNGFSDPYVKVQLKPDPHQRRFKTSVKWKNLNPEFHEDFFFDTALADLSNQTLDIAVWDKDLGKSNDYIGGLQLGVGSKGQRLQHWNNVIHLIDQKHQQWHQLANV